MPPSSAAPVTLRRYHFPNLNGEGWGTFVLGSDGFFSAVSDYGNYATRWTATGGDLRRWLARGLDWQYLARNVAMHKLTFDPRQTYEAVADYILHRRRRDGASKEWAAGEWEILQLYREDDGIQESEWSGWQRHTKIGEPWDMACYSWSADIKAFGEILFPRLQQILQAEIAAEDASGIEPVITRYTLDGPNGGLSFDDIHVERARNLANQVKWAIRHSGDCLDKDGLWRYEPLPSYRDDAFFAACRWDSLDEALAAARKARTAYDGPQAP